MKRRLLTIGHSYVLGVNRRLATELQRQSGGRWEVTVVTPERFIGKNDLRPQVFEADADEPTTVVPLPARLTDRVHFFWYGGGLRRLVKEGGFDLIHAWEEPYILAGWQIARAARGVAPLVYRSAQSLPKRYPPPFSWIERYCVDQMSGWIFSGSLVEQNLLLRPGYADKPRHCSPLGYDTSTMVPDPESGLTVLSELGWEDGVPVVGYLGRLVEEKGIRVMLRALEQVEQPWRLLLVGDGPLNADVRSWAEGYPGRVALMDRVKHSEVARYLNAMDLLVAPSLTAPHWREQFGRMLVEAFACGSPVIGSDSGEIPFVIGDAGIVTPEGDHKALAGAVTRLLTDDKLRGELREAGLRRAESRYTWERIATNTLEFFDSIVDRNR